MSDGGVPARPRSWLITGVSSGFGRALAQAALGRGELVAGTVRNEAARNEFEQLAPGRSHGVMLDVTDRKAVRRVVAGVEAWAGGAEATSAGAAVASAAGAAIGCTATGVAAGCAAGGGAGCAV